MKLAVLTAGFYDRDYDEKFTRLKWSADHFSIPLQVFGRGEFFSFFDSKINKLGVTIDNLKNDYTHVLYTDFADSFFLSGLDEIIEKYAWMGSPELLVAGEKNLHPFGGLKDIFPETSDPYRFFNPGNFIAEIPAILDVLSKCKRYYTLQTNDQGHWLQAYAEYKFPMVIDTKAVIFQTMSDAEFEKEFQLRKNGKLQNLITNEFPSIVHFNGPKGPGTENFRLSELVFNNLQTFARLSAKTINENI
jgi:hypothetical protein